ncbi:MAG: surface-adhesin E family protein, partial [Gallionellaceae bacterium]
MRTLFLMMLFALSHSAMADWVKVHGSAIQVTYANPATIDLTGSNIKMGLLSDYKKPQKYEGRQFLSVMSQNEYDCDDAQLRMLSYSLHAGNMGKGEVVYTDPSRTAW